jgi:hypothetical protein
MLALNKTSVSSKADASFQDVNSIRNLTVQNARTPIIRNSVHQDYF